MVNKRKYKHFLSGGKRGFEEKLAMSLKAPKPIGKKQCPVCSKKLPIKKFINLNNRRMKQCNECRQKMGVK